MTQQTLTPTYLHKGRSHSDEVTRSPTEVTTVELMSRYSYARKLLSDK
jgi:hypothetical protein